MPIAEDQMAIPSELPEMLKQFTIDAINTQPADLLEWSYMYFNALKNGYKLPTEQFQERDRISEWAVLSPEILKDLHRKLGGRLTITSSELKVLWNYLHLSPDLYSSIMLVGGLTEQIEWLKFFALACSALGVPNSFLFRSCETLLGVGLSKEESRRHHDIRRRTIAKTLRIACEVLSDGVSGPPRIPFSTFQFLYRFLAAVDGEVSEQQVHQMLNYLEQHVIGPDGIISISDFTENPRVRLE